MPQKLTIDTPRWALPLLPHARYKGAKGGRGSGKSHFFAELLVEEHIANPDQQTVCIREIQKSLKFSAKKLIEDKIRALGVQELFDITMTEIRRVGGQGIIIFQGMQDHTADSIKSLEGFNRAWIEEAQSISARSMELLLPTIRAPGSELWFSWNPDQPDDPVELHFKDVDDDTDFILVHVNYQDNPFCPDELIQEAKRHARVSPETYNHVWLGGYNTRNEAQVFHGKWRVEEFEPGEDWQPMFGADWGFAQDATTAVEVYVVDRTLYIRREAYKVGLEQDHIPGFFKRHIPGIDRHVIRADSARPETISHVKGKGLPKTEGVKKWPGSVEDGVEYMRSFDEIVIHPDCEHAAEEFRLYSYKVHKQTGDILPQIDDSWNHCIDAVRYSLQPLIRQVKTPKLKVGH